MKYVEVNEFGEYVEINEFGFSDISDAVKNGFDAAKHSLDVNLDNVRKFAIKFFPATVIARNSFLALVKVNAFNLAHRLKDTAEAGGGQRVVNLWVNDLGGEAKALDIAISNGNNGISINMAKNIVNGISYAPKSAAQLQAEREHNDGMAFMNALNEYLNRLNIRKPTSFSDRVGGAASEYEKAYNKFIAEWYAEKKNSFSGDFENFDPATDAALVAAAGTVIAAISPLLIKNDKKDKDAAQLAIETGTQVVTDLIKNNNLPPDYQGQVTYKGKPVTGSGIPTGAGAGTGVGTGVNINVPKSNYMAQYLPIILVVIAAIAAFMLLKKK
jgi:hypothetical protein